jgi:CheY-like chemotaxis protein
MSRAYLGPKKMLLCVDDSHGVLEYERTLFERSGYTVVTATSALEGLRLAALADFDVVLLDYQMPEMSGHQLAQEIKSRRPDVKVIIFSGSEIPQATHQLVDAVVSKDEATRQLLPTVTRLCSRES